MKRIYAYFERFSHWISRSLSRLRNYLRTILVRFLKFVFRAKYPIIRDRYRQFQTRIDTIWEQTFNPNTRY